MGSKAVREAHLMQYGSVDGGKKGTKYLTKSQHYTKQRSDHFVDSLSGEPTHPNQLNPTTQLNSTQSYPERDSDQDTEKDGDVQPPMIVRSTAYPADWRCLPHQTAHMDLEWLYASVSMDRQQSADTVLDAAIRQLKRLFAQRGIASYEMISRREARALTRSSKRFAVSVDIVATRRRLLSGEPHNVAMKIYSFIERAYPIIVVFAAVGITDNQAKRPSRDVLYPSPIAGFKKMSFDAIDNQHMMFVHPDGRDTENICELGRKIASEKDIARRARTFTPKFELSSAQKVIESRAIRCLASWKARRFSILHERTSDTPDCDRCWRHSRPISPVSPAFSTNITTAHTPAVEDSQNIKANSDTTLLSSSGLSGIKRLRQQKGLIRDALSSLPESYSRDEQTQVLLDVIAQIAERRQV